MDEETKVESKAHIHSVDMPRFVFDAFVRWIEGTGAIVVLEYPAAIQPEDAEVTQYMVAPKGFAGTE